MRQVVESLKGVMICSRHAGAFRASAVLVLMSRHDDVLILVCLGVYSTWAKMSADGLRGAQWLKAYSSASSVESA